MFKLPSPAMALNSHDVPGARYRMYNTYEVPEGDDAAHLLGWIAAVARGAPGGVLNSVVLNCHGFYGTGMDGKLLGGFGLKMGKGILRADTSKFSVLAGFVQCIWDGAPPAGPALPESRLRLRAPAARRRRRSWVGPSGWWSRRRGRSRAGGPSG
jgi:hypothetical protein